MGDDGFQNMFVYQPLFDTTTLELKKYKSTDYVLVGNQKRVYTSKLKPLYTAFLHSTKPSGYRIGIRFEKNSVTVA